MYPDYQNSIMNVSATILKHYHAPNPYASIFELEQELAKNYQHVHLILLDGMGINIIKKHLKPTDFLYKNMVKKITSVFPPTTVAATNSVLSGLPPYATGYLGWVQYFKKEKTNAVVFTNEDFYDKNIQIKEVLRDKYLRYPTIYEQIAKSSADVKTFELFPSFRANGFESFKKQTIKILEISSMPEKTFTYTYWIEPDMTQHDVGIDDQLTQNVLHQLNKDCEDLANKINNKTLLIIIADHGLVNVEGIDLFDNQKILKCMKRKPSIETRATTFFIKAFKKRKFKSLFKAQYGDHFILMTKKELYDSKLLGDGTKHVCLDDFLGDFIAISTGQYMFNFKDHSTFKGHHAGLTQGEMEVPLILYHHQSD